MVLTKKCGLSVHETVGALKHFGVKPTPRALLDALLTSGEGRGAIDSNDPDGLIEVHRKVSGAYGVGVASNNNMSYLLVRVNTWLTFRWLGYCDRDRPC